MQSLRGYVCERKKRESATRIWRSPESVTLGEGLIFEESFTFTFSCLLSDVPAALCSVYNMSNNPDENAVQLCTVSRTIDIFSNQLLICLALFAVVYSCICVQILG